ncbi:MAG: DUF1326 domain-containing protein [Proteobacteria bacterium]|nr:DUF1326 domain-containing protein [Pseudomonadota bacterium]
MSSDWNLQGELILNCNCDVFCPCVVSLGRHAPTQGYCHGWAGVEIRAGRHGATDLSGLNVGLLLDIPGKMANGNWTTALYVDERASPAATEALTSIFSGAAGGTTGLFKLLVSTFLGVKRAPIRFERDGKVRRFTIDKVLNGAIEPIAGQRAGEDVVITNTEYWMGPDVTVSRSLKSKLRDFGRVWDLSGRSAEIVAIDWRGP